LAEYGVIMAGNCLKSLRERENQWKKQDRLLEISQVGGGIMGKLA
jgi:hypothetical protein